MKNIFLFDKNRSYLNKYEQYKYFWYKGHYLMFKALIFRGRKLWAFNFMTELKFIIKTRYFLNPFWAFVTSVLKILPSLILRPKRLGTRF